MRVIGIQHWIYRQWTELIVWARQKMLVPPITNFSLKLLVLWMLTLHIFCEYQQLASGFSFIAYLEFMLCLSLAHAPFSFSEIKAIPF